MPQEPPTTNSSCSAADDTDPTAGDFRQVATDTGDGPASAYPGDEVRDAPVGLLP
jgi:hypothetical protein